MEKKKYLIVISGATATGKTRLAIKLAQHFNSEILSCDSRQFYREMNIGTAKPTPEELSLASHHFVNSLSIHQHYTVGDFEKDALQLLGNIYERMDTAILVGGSGLFIRALCDGLDEYPTVSHTMKEDLERLFKEKGIEALQEELKESDPVYFEKVDLQNAHRLMRALGVCRVSGQAFSSFQKKEKKSRFFHPLYIQVTLDRAVLYNRINQRVDEMMEEGLLEEARNLYPSKHLNALQTVGYQEFMDYFDEKINLETAVELVKRNSRRYAKRQMTWFRKNDFWKVFSPEKYEAIVEYIEGEII